MAKVAREQWSIATGRLSALLAGSGETVLLLHGIPSSAELWRDLVGDLAGAGFRALAPDLPGYGATRLPNSADYSLSGCANLIARWLSDESFTPVWVVGHDAGGAVAQLLAVRHPQTVSRMTLTNSIVDGCWPAPRARLAKHAARAGLYRAASRIGLVPNPFIRWGIRRGFKHTARLTEADAERIFWDGKVSDRQGRKAFENHLAALTPRDTAAIAPALARLTIPVQLLWGAADPYQRWDGAGRRLQSLLPEAVVTRLDDCGHFAPLDCPDRFLQAMLSWYRTDAA